MKQYIKLGFLCFLLTSCVSTKYSYTVDKQDPLNFSEGKWILNTPYSNKNIKHISEIALKEFRSILGDSLIEINDLRSNFLVENKLPYEPTTSELKDLRIGTKCDYLINYKVTVLKNEIGSFSSPPPIGIARKTNEALVEILIYDLKSQTLLSKSSILGSTEVELSDEDSGWDYVKTANVIARGSLMRLIRKLYKNNIQ